jgi:hypothetical protein
MPSTSKNGDNNIAYASDSIAGAIISGISYLDLLEMTEGFEIFVSSPISWHFALHLLGKPVVDEKIQIRHNSSEI